VLPDPGFFICIQLPRIKEKVDSGSCPKFLPTKMYNRSTLLLYRISLVSAPTNRLIFPSFYLSQMIKMKNTGTGNEEKH